MPTSLLTVPNEILYEITRLLPLRSVIALLKTCRAITWLIDAFLLSSYKNEMLVSAARKNNLTTLKRALSAGAHINHSPNSRGTALYNASANGHTAIIAELLLHNPALEDRGNNNRTPILSAALGGHEAAIDLLLAAGADPDATSNRETLLINAIGSNLTRTATAFIHQMDATALDHAIEYKRFTIAKAMFDRGIATTVPPPIHQAVCSGIEYVKLCIDHGADIDSIQGPDEDDDGGSTALGVAANRGDTHIMRYLLSKGADPNAGEYNALPTVNAITRCRTDALRMLLQHGADVQWMRDDTELLWMACTGGPRELVAVLLDAFDALGGDWSWVGNPELLHTAVMNEHVDVVQLLLERGAVVNALSGEDTPLVCAVKAWSRELVEVLLAGGADPRIAAGGKTPLIWVKDSDARLEAKGLMMATLIRAGADINDLSKTWKKKINGYVRRLEQEIGKA